MVNRKVELGSKEGSQRPPSPMSQFYNILDSPNPKVLNIYFWTFWKASQCILGRIILILRVRITLVTIVNVHGESLIQVFVTVITALHLLTH